MKVKEFKKVSLRFFVALMVVALIAGCSKNSNDSNSSASNAPASSAASKDDNKSNAEFVTLNAVFPGQESNAAKSVVQAINEKLKADGYNFGVNIKYVDDYWNKLALDIAGGTSYDVAWAHSSTLSDLVSKKVYQPIDDALQANGPELLANTPEHVLKGGAVSGKQYAIARAIPMTAFNNVFNIRGDLREKYGIPKITTLEGLEAYFDAIAKNEPDMYVIVGQNVQPMFPVYANYYFPIGDGSKYPVYIDPTDSTYTVKSFWDSEAYTNIATKRKEWRDKGWQPADSTRIDNADAGFDHGQLATVAANIMRASERIDSVTTNVPGAIVETVYLEPAKRFMFSAGDNMLAVPSTSKHPNEAVALINWIKKSQENYDLWSYGVEGINYKLVDGAVDLNGIADNDKYNTNVWMWNDISLARFSANYPKSDIETLKTWDSQSEITPFVGFTLDQSKIKAQVSQLNAVMDEYAQNIGLGVTDINKVRDEIMKKMNAAGLQEVIKETQRQIDEYVKTK